MRAKWTKEERKEHSVMAKRLDYGKWMTGKKLSEEHKRNIGLGVKGMRLSEKTKRKISKAHKGMKLSEETRRKISISHKGKVPWNKGIKTPQIQGSKNGNWNGGVTKGYSKVRTSRRWREWRKEVFVRDNYTCLLCGERNVELHPHHLKGVTYFPKNRFEVNNGLTICKNCHYLIHQSAELIKAGWYLKKEVG